MTPAPGSLERAIRLSLERSLSLRAESPPAPLPEHPRAHRTSSANKDNLSIEPHSSQADVSSASQSESLQLPGQIFRKATMVPVPEELLVPAPHTANRVPPPHTSMWGRKKLPPDVNPSSIEVESDPKGLSRSVEGSILLPGGGLSQISGSSPRGRDGVFGRMGSAPH